MSNDGWQAGDLALCIRGGPITRLGRPPLEGYPVKGAIYTVRGFGPFEFAEGIRFALFFTDAPMNRIDRVWNAVRFVKVTPLEEDEFDKEIINLYKEKEKVT